MSLSAPNILVIMADQLAPQFTGAYGHPLVKTPNIDALAACGMRFDAAYCNAPLCAPSRASFMSGQLISRIGTFDNASEFPAAIPTFAHYLKLMGYRTSLSGKMHFVGPDQLHGFEERVTTDIYPSDYAWTPDWTDNETRIDKWYHNMQTVRESGTAAATFQLDYDDEVAFFACRKLTDYARDGARPFCMVASFIHPHDPYVARPEFWDLYEDEKIDLPEHPMDLDELDPFSQRVMKGIEADTAALTRSEIIRARRAYYANTSYFDSKVGALVATLKANGQFDDTVIIITSDHGDMLGEKGLWYKMSFFEHSARVPLVISGPGIKPGTCGAACSLVDVLPTMLDIAGLEGAQAPELGMPIDGRSLWSVLAGGDDPTSEAIGEYCAEMAGHPVIMIRRDTLKYIHCDSDPPLLFDLEKDPSELHNCAGDPAYADTVRAFAREVEARWDLPALRNDIIAAQKQRRSVNAAMEAGATAHWDYNPPRDATQEYVRNHMDWTVAAARYRYPPI